MQTAGHLIVDQLEAAGIARVYSVPGESFLDVLDGLYDSSIVNVVARQEGGAGFMALAEGRLTSKPGVVLVTRGPGAANAMIAVHTAWQDQTPLVLMVGLIPVADRNRESFQEFNLHAWFGSTAKKVMILDDPSSAARLVDDALYTAATGRPGPVVIGLTEDVLLQLTDAETVPPRPAASPASSPAQLAALGAHLDRAERPLIIVGGGGWDGNTGAELAAWATISGIPIAADFRAYDAVPHDSPSYVGSLGYGRSDALARRLDDADLLVYLGCARTDVGSDGYQRGVDVPTVVINTDTDLHGHWGRVDLQLVSSVANLVGSLPKVVAHPTADWLDVARAEHLAFAIPTALPDGGVDLYTVMEQLAESIEADAVVTFGAGNHALWPARYIAHNSPHSLAAPRNGAMGLSVPAGVAASLIFPGRRVVTVSGDGEFMMNGQELATAAGYGASLLAIVVDNGCFATIRQHQEARYPERPSGTQLTNPDFATLARSYGLHGETVRTTGEFAPALDRALKSSTGALIHVFTDPETRTPKTA